MVWAAPKDRSLGDTECLIESNQQVDIRSPVVGLLESVAVARGDKVRSGQVIAVLEQQVEKAATELAHYKSGQKGPLAAAESRLEFARRKFERHQGMKAENFMSAQESDDAEAEMKLAEAELQTAKENLQISKLEWQQQAAQLKQRTITSPFEGIVVEQGLYPGEVVEPGAEKKPILRLAQLNPLRVHAILPFSAFSQVKVGTDATIFPEAPLGGQLQGKIKIVDRLVDAASGSFGVFIEVANPNMDIPAGVRCRVNFTR